MIKPEDIKVEVHYSEGYQERYTKAWLEIIRKREERNENNQRLAANTA